MILLHLMSLRSMQNLPAACIGLRLAKVKHNLAVTHSNLPMSEPL